MRDIKFRGRMKAKCYDGQWREGDYVRGSRDCFGCFIDHGIVISKHFPEEVDGETIGQFTGLCDKNGKEIFCGDITSLDKGYIAVIDWNKETASFCAKYGDNSKSDHLYGAHLCEV
ncbi:MAG: YopX family protein, partial [Thiotrichaceae bacterium]